MRETKQDREEEKNKDTRINLIDQSLCFKNEKRKETISLTSNRLKTDSFFLIIK